jgi:hypothetical protein
MACSEACPGSACGAVCCAAGASCSAKKECVFGDLTLTAEDILPEHLSTVLVAEDSCAPQEGCVTGTGERAVARLDFTLKNVGKAAVTIGDPWNNPAFDGSACSSQAVLRNFVQAEVVNSKGKVVARGNLPTTCVADEDGVDFHCAAQGLSAGGESQQPQGTCDTLDLTGLLPGAYKVRLTVNPSGRLAELNYKNNTIEINLEYPECDGNMCGGLCCPEGLGCENDVCLAPDVRPHKGAVEDSLVITRRAFGEDSCEIAEACVGGPGKRRLLNFESRIENVGPGDLSPGAEYNNPLFEFSTCHGHNHFLNFTDYRLLTPDGKVVTKGHKQAFCLVDMAPVEDYVAPQDGLRPEPGQGGCNHLSAGWADIYGVGTDCQWVDITDVQPGEYILQVSVNPLGAIGEVNVENNVVQVPVVIPADFRCQDEEVCGDIADQDCDGRSDRQEPECAHLYQAECCGPMDTCNWGFNGSCDCGGAAPWEQWDCQDKGGDAGAGGPSWEEGCCNEEDTCNFANDSICDCNAEFEWDSRDCLGSVIPDFGDGGAPPDNCFWPELGPPICFPPSDDASPVGPPAPAPHL